MLRSSRNRLLDQHPELNLHFLNVGVASHSALLVAKFENRFIGTLADMASVKTRGMVEELPDAGLVKIAKPIGVIAALNPTTGPYATPPVKAFALSRYATQSSFLRTLARCSHRPPS